GLNAALRLRPDPLVVAGGTRASDRAGAATAPSLAFSVRTMISHPRARLALAAMVISQASMVAVMAMTPVHLKLHGHEGVSHFVISTHVAGMFAFSPLVGRYSDRRGKVPAILVGSSVLLGATVLAAMSGDVEQLLFP